MLAMAFLGKVALSRLIHDIIINYTHAHFDNLDLDTRSQWVGR